MSYEVFVVDDEPRVRDSVTELLENAGISCRGVESTEKFLASFQYSPETDQCVIADLRMPGMSGLDLKRELMAIDCSVPVILLTGYRDDETDARAAKLGIFEILEKPYPPLELVNVTRRALAESRNCDAPDAGEG